jgi:hypothetical protein
LGRVGPVLQRLYVVLLAAWDSLRWIWPEMYILYGQHRWLATLPAEDVVLSACDRVGRVRQGIVVYSYIVIVARVGKGIAVLYW